MNVLDCLFSLFQEIFCRYRHLSGKEDDAQDIRYSHQRFKKLYLDRIHDSIDTISTMQGGGETVEAVMWIELYQSLPYFPIVVLQVMDPMISAEV